MVEEYKHTEIGFIPRDWEVKTLKDVGEVNMCRRVFAYQTRTNGVIPFYKIGTFGKKPNTYISKELYNDYRKKYSYPKKGDILISAAGTIGRTVIYDGEISYFQDSNIVWLANNEKLVLNKYLFYLYKVIDYNTEGSTIKRLYNNIIYSTKFSCPNINEQKSIAEVLSDTDELIHTFEKRIAKKRLIKQGAMQKLFTPKEGWETKKLGNLVDNITTGKLDANAMKKDGQYRFYTCARKHYFIDEYAFDNEALLVSGNGANVGYIHYYNGKFNAYQRTYVITGFVLSVDFLKLYMDKFLRIRIDEQKNDGNTPYIKMDTLTDMKITYPNSNAEQKSIASIFSDMDKEIEQLEEKLVKYKDVKQGLMQQLLTGKIRLV